MEPQQLKMRDYKPYKKLSLAQRIQVIKAYTFMPNYRQLAIHFGCSQMQIKTTMARKDELLQSYESARAKNLNTKTDNSNEAKIELLGKVVFEFLLRALNLRLSTDATAIRDKALEVKKVLSIENFTPNDAWLHSFKIKHNRLDPMEMMEQLEHDMDKRRSLDCNDIIEYVREQEREEQRKLLAEDERIAIVSKAYEELCKDDQHTEQTQSAHKACDKWKTMKAPTARNPQRYLKADISALMSIISDVKEQSAESTSRKSKTIESTKDLQPIEINIKTEATEDDLVSVVKVESSEIGDSTSMTTQTPTTTHTKRSSCIRNYTEALRHLRILENFVMTEENYSALSLITQLEYIFRNVVDSNREST